MMPHSDYPHLTAATIKKLIHESNAVDAHKLRQFLIHAPSIELAHKAIDDLRRTQPDIFHPTDIERQYVT